MKAVRGRIFMVTCGGGRVTTFEADIYTDGGRHVIVMSERHDNKGFSVTNASEHLATYMVNEGRVDAGTCTWVEHYPEHATWDVVEYDWLLSRAGHCEGGWLARSPRWRPAPEAARSKLRAGLMPDPADFVEVNETDLMNKVVEDIVG